MNFKLMKNSYLPTNEGPVKIALIGGMNNNFFAMLRYLECLGYRCDLFLFSNEQDHFTPENDEWEYEKYGDRIFELPYPDGLTIRAFLDSFFSRKKMDFGGYDFVFGCGYTPMYSVIFGFKLDILFPYGSDLSHATSYRRVFKKISPLAIAKNIFFNLGAYIQRLGIRRCGVCWMLTQFEAYKRVQVLQHIERVRLPTPMVYNAHKERDSKIDQKLKSYVKLEDIENTEYVVASQARHLWTGHSSMTDLADQKFNNRLIEAFSRFLDSPEGSAKSRLVLFLYGNDVQESKRLIEQLGIDDFVIWAKLMPRKYILYFFEHFVTIGADQFGVKGMGGSSYEILSSGKPLLTYVDGDWFEEGDFRDELLSTTSGVLNCQSVDEIFSQMVNHYGDTSLQVELQKNAIRFFNENMGMGAALKVSEWIHEKMRNRRDV